MGRYGLALLCVALAAALRGALPEALGPTPFLAFYLAWVAAAAFGGLGPGLVAMAASWLCVDLFFDPTSTLVNFSDPATASRFAVLLAGGIGVSVVAEMMRRARAEERRRTEQVAIAQQEWARTFDAMPDLVAIIDPECRILHVNRAMAERLGTSDEACVGQACYRCMHNLDGPPDYCPHAQTLADGNEHTAEVHDERTGRDFLVSSTPLRDPHGRYIGIIEVAHDITKRKRAEENLREANEELQEQTEELSTQTEELRAQTEELMSTNDQLRESEERLALALSGTQVAMCERDIATGQLRCTEQFSRLMGLRPTTTLSQDYHYDDWGLRVHREDLPQVETELDRCMAEHQPFAVEYRVRWPDGSVRWLAERGVFQYDVQDQPTRMLGIVMDITDRKQAEEALRRSEEQFHRLFEDDLTGDYVSTPEGQILLCNPAFAEMFGFSSARDAVGASILDLYIDPTEREPLIQRLKPEGKTKRLEVWRKRLDGEPIHIVENLVGHFNEQGELYEILGYLFEDTERKHAEEALRDLAKTLESRVAQRTASLEHRSKQLQKLAIDLSDAEDKERRRLAEILHDDLQQVLAGAKFHLSVMRNKLKQDGALRALGAQIDQILGEAVEKSRSLSHQLRPGVLAHGSLPEVFAWLAGQMQAKQGLTVHVETVGEDVDTQVDALRSFLYKAGQELLFNVVKHAQTHEAWIRLRRTGRHIHLEVRDRGRGFDPRAVKEAAGFGLFTLRERAETLGGRMTIRSHPGKGSTFRVVVPDAQKAERAKGRAGETAKLPHSPIRPFADSSSPHALRVLLADDQKIVREGLASLLSEDTAIEVVGEANNGREAVELTDRLQPDVVVIDVSMPELDGEEATRQIKARQPQTRVVALSMHEEAIVAEKMQQAGAATYVVKTAPSEELFAAIHG